MTQVANLGILKGIDDPSLKGRTQPFLITTTTLNINSLAEFNAYIRSFRVTNKDALAVLNYRFDEVRAPLIEIPPSTDDRQEGWTTFIQIIPNGVSGQGQVEVELIPREIAEIGRT